MEDFHESIHLCNNAIQQKYKNGERSSNLPEENMWDNDTFINYLRQVREREGTPGRTDSNLQTGQPEGWSNIVYPGMKKCLIGSLLATQGLIDHKSLLYAATLCLSGFI